MAYSIDFLFEPVDDAPASWLAEIDSALRRSGLRRLASVQPLEVDEDGEVDTGFPIENLTDWDEVVALSDRSPGVALVYSTADFDLAMYLWRSSRLHVVGSINGRQWSRLASPDRFRVGGILSAVAATVGSRFGFSAVESTLTRDDPIPPARFWSALQDEAAPVDLAWVSDELTTMEALRLRAGSGRDIRASLSGYFILVPVADGGSLS